MLVPVAILIFATALCVFFAIYLAVQERQSSPRAELKRRLQRMARSGAREMPEDLRAEITREEKPADKFFARLRLTRDLDKKLDHAGLKMSVSAFLARVAAVAMAAAAIAGLLTRSMLLAAVFAIVSWIGATLFLKVKTAQRREKFTELFPDALSMIARSLHAGHSFTAAVELIGQECPPPVGELFKAAYDQQQLGLRVVDGLNNMNNRMESLDLKFFTTVVAINSEIGGNLSDVLEKLAVTIRERMRIRRQVKVYTAQGRMSGYVIGALPLLVFILLNVLNPRYVEPFYTPLGFWVLLTAVCLQLLGFLVIRKIIQIKI